MDRAVRSGGHPRTRRVRLGLSAVLAVLLAGILGPLAPPAGAETRLDVTAGYAGFHVPGRALPVQVTVTAERLVSGELAVLRSGKEPIATVPVEVAGGSVKRFTLIVPGGVTDATGAVDVELRSGGRALGRGRAEVRSAEDAELVGLGPQLVEGRTLPGPAPLAIDAGVARFAALDSGLLAQAPTSLDGLSAVGLASGELAGLAPGVRAGLLRWVAGGGHLLVDEPSGTAVDGLPAEWQPGPSGRAAAGNGEVRLTGDAMAAGRWAGLVEPSSVGHSGSGNGFFSPESVADSLARDAGLRLPGLPWLLGFLGLYILVVGPLTGMVLRRRRRPDLAWVVVPGLAVAFTVLAYVAGNQLRPGAGLAHGTVVETGASGPVATSWVALTRRTAGTAHVELPAGWAVEGTAASCTSGFAVDPGFGGCPKSSADPGTPSVGAGDAGPEVRLPLASGEFGMFKASGPAQLVGRLEVTATSAADGQAQGTVKNGLPFALDDVVVFVEAHRATVGHLAPGEQKEWTAGGDRIVDPSMSEPWSSDPNSWRPGRLVNLSLWQSAQDDIGQDGDATGTAMAVGWTRDWQPVVTVDGKERHAPGRTAIVGRAPVTPSGRRLTDLTVAADVVRGPSLNPFRGKFIGNSNGEATVLKLTLPAGDPAASSAAPGGKARGGKTGGAASGANARGPQLALRTSLRLSDVAVWQDGAWRHLEIPFNPNDLGAILRFKRGIAVNGGVTVQVPSGAIPAPPPPPALITPTTVPPLITAVPPGAAQVPAVAAPGVVAVPGGNATVDIPLPDGIGADGVVFLRLVTDQSAGVSPDAVVVSLVEVAR